MVDVKTETKPQTKPVNPRTAIREARQRRLRLVASGRAATVKVYAANETMQAVLRHPVGKVRFHQEIDQPVEWPNDSFTARRIADGSVRTDGPGSGEEAEPDESLNPRQQSAARKPKEPKQANGPKEASRPSAKSRPEPEPQPTA
jgi:hypothetical protein